MRRPIVGPNTTEIKVDLMTETDIYFRDATPDDAEALAQLINFAGEGLPLYLWERLAEPGENAWDVGCRRARREEGGFSYRNTVVAAIETTVVACLIGYPIPPQPEPINYQDMPAMFVPLQELENLAPDTWYVNVLAAFPAYRGRGIGTQLLEIAEETAAAAGHQGLSIIVSDANTSARRLYERCGYRYIAKRPMVKDQWRNPGRDWLLLVK